MGRFLHWLARPRLLHWLLPYLMLLIAVGTIAQRSIGLFESQKRYFSSLILWMGGVPLPGGRAACALFLLSLLAKLIVASPWRREKAGIFIAHLGVALLLLGGVLSTSFSTEGFVVLGVHRSTAEFSDYHDREFSIRKNGAKLFHASLDTLRAGTLIENPALPFALQVEKQCGNCTMQMREATDEAFKGPARKVTLKPLPGELEDERNLAGLEVTVRQAAAEADGTYLLFEPISQQPSFSIGADRYALMLARKTYALPFTVELLDAEKKNHPGTEMPRSYSSTVLIRDGALEQRAVITMNHPLRYKGYTLYQSSFFSAAKEGEPALVSFTVVQNTGRVFPYVASVTICIGLLIHLWRKLPTLLRRDREEVV